MAWHVGLLGAPTAHRYDGSLYVERLYAVSQIGMSGLTPETGDAPEGALTDYTGVVHLVRHRLPIRAKGPGRFLFYKSLKV